MTDLFDTNKPDGPDIPSPKRNLFEKKPKGLMGFIKKIFGKSIELKQPPKGPGETPSMGGFMPPPNDKMANPRPANDKMAPINKPGRFAFLSKLLKRNQGKDAQSVDDLKDKLNLNNDRFAEKPKEAPKEKPAKPAKPEMEKKPRMGNLNKYEAIQSVPFSSVFIAWFCILALSPVFFIGGTALESYFSPPPPPNLTEFALHPAEYEREYNAKIEAAVVVDPDADRRDYFIPLSENHGPPEVPLRLDKPDKFKELYESIADEFPPSNRKFWQSKGRILNGIDPTKPKILIIVTPIGTNVDIDKKFMELKYPMTLGLLPTVSEDFKTSLRNLASTVPHEYLTALAMQPKNSREIFSPNQINIDDEPKTIVKKILWSTSQVPESVGVINLMGSGIMGNSKGAMVIETIKKIGFYAIESQETLTNLYKFDRKTFKDILTSDVTIDNELDGRKIRSQLNVAEAIAKEKGAAVVIAHPTMETYQVLSYWLKTAKTRGYELITPSTFFSMLGN